jgi:hypothetical protein
LPGPESDLRVFPGSIGDRISIYSMHDFRISERIEASRALDSQKGL